MRTKTIIVIISVCVAILIIGAYALIMRRGQPPAEQQEAAPVSETVADPVRVTVTDVPDEIARASVAPPPAAVTADPDPPGLVISGVVVTSGEGEPAAGAFVSAYTTTAGAVRSTAGDDGAFRIVGLDAGDYRVSATLEGYNEAVIDAVRAGTSGVRLELEPLSAVEGRVVNGETGEPFDDFEILYMKRPPGSDEYWRTLVQSDTARWRRVADSEGRYRLENVDSGAELAVGARAAGFEPAYTVVAPIEPGETAQAEDIALLPEATVAGRVVSSGGVPVSGADIYLGGTPDGRAVAHSNPDGRFTLNQLGEGPITLTADHRDYLPGSADAHLARGRQTEIEIVMGSGGSVTGTVYDGSAPLAGQTVRVTRMIPPRVSKREITDDTGAYWVHGLPPGEIEVYASILRSDEPDTIPMRMHKKAIIEDGEVTVVDFQTAAAASSIEGLITVAGAPAGSASVRGYVAGESGDTFFSTSANEQGAYALYDLTAGDAWLEVTVTLEGGLERRQNIPLSVPHGQTVRQDVAFDGSAAVQGAITNLAANEAAEIYIVSGNYMGSSLDIDEVERLMVASSEVSEDGQYRLTGLDPGEYTIIAIAFDPDEMDLTGQLPAIRSGSRTVTLDSGHEHPADLVIY